MGERAYLAENVKLRLDTETLRAIEVLAEAGDRTVAAEMRRALREYINAQSGDGKEASP